MLHSVKCDFKGEYLREQSSLQNKFCAWKNIQQAAERSINHLHRNDLTQYQYQLLNCETSVLTSHSQMLSFKLS